MAIIKYSNRRPTAAPWLLGDELNRLARFFDDVPATGWKGSWSPAVSVTEGKDALVLTAELPGIAEENVAVELENDVLSISGEKVAERKEEDEERRYHVVERSYGSFRRTFKLPRTVDAEAVTAAYENGVLTVTMPKAAEAKGRKIEISKN